LTHLRSLPSTVIVFVPLTAVAKSLDLLYLSIPNIFNSPATASTLPPASIHVE
jgi:hypothetical protein